MTEEFKSKIVWQEDKDFGKVCTLTESALNGIINEATKELQEELKAEKEYNATLRKEIDEYTNSHILCAKYKELEKQKE